LRFGPEVALDKGELSSSVMRARDNPFRSERILQLRYRLEGITWAELLKRCEALGGRAALVGPCGSGKTTLLEQLVPRFRERGLATHFIRLNHETGAFEPGFISRLAARLTGRDVLLLDGAEQLSLARWHWFKWRTRRAGRLIITTHLPGRLPTLWECRTSTGLLRQLAADLLQTDSGCDSELAQDLFLKHRGNLREALRECYDLAGSGQLKTHATRPNPRRDLAVPAVFC